MTLTYQRPPSWRTSTWSCFRSRCRMRRWWAACMARGTLLLVVLAPINLLLRQRPEDSGLLPDGDAAPNSSSAPQPSNVVNETWAAVDWTLGRAMCTAPFWWIALAYFSGLYAWYVGATRPGYTSRTSAWAHFSLVPVSKPRPSRRYWGRESGRSRSAAAP